MWTRFLIQLLVIVVAVNACACQNTVEVKVKNGFVSGKIEKTFLNSKVYNVFKGIPYAEPPIGELRFKPPKPHQNWEHIYEAFKDKPTCVQFSSRRRNGEKVGISGSEDCLHLSIFTPNLQGSRAVLVFDYHDHFQTGFNGTRTYSPQFLTEEDVIVVSVSHRLGLLGYLTTEDDVIPPNNGLRDYILALKWIKENIKLFGGDPDRVTLMGCQGGGALANNLLYSEAAKGLFHAITIQSGTAHEPKYFPKNPRDYAFKLGGLIEIEAEDSSTLLKGLQEVEFQKLIENEAGVLDFEYFDTHQLNIYPFAPVVEKDGPEAIITTLPENGQIVNDVPVLIGFNSREGLEYNSEILFEPRIINSHETFIHFPIRSNFRFDRNNSAYDSLKDDIITFYLKAGYLNYNNIIEYSVYIGDALANYALNTAAKKISKELKSSTYYYKFDFLGILNENMIYLARHTRGSLEYWGASVGDEICYLHLCSRIRDNYEELKKLVVDQNELKVLKKMIRLWSNFAKTGNPTPDKNDKLLKNFTWEPVDKSSDDLAFAHITKTLKMGKNPLGKREKFWDSTLKKYSEMVVEGVVQSPETNKPHEEL
uniref:Carboxyl/choline esterase CCE021 n=1 Tax=Glyphodes pyloalis TaxID=1242752 RepID=A0A5J6BW35_GLYPY|nr:carboxyl/choline esterase CCE021 [Glyphodes pyloalis]